jgi:hypothetical protein
MNPFSFIARIISESDLLSSMREEMAPQQTWYEKLAAGARVVGGYTLWALAFVAAVLAVVLIFFMFLAR